MLFSIMRSSRKRVQEARIDNLKMAELGSSQQVVCSTFDSWLEQQFGCTKSVFHKTTPSLTACYLTSFQQIKFWFQISALCWMLPYAFQGNIDVACCVQSENSERHSIPFTLSVTHANFKRTERMWFEKKKIHETPLKSKLFWLILRSNI